MEVKGQFKRPSSIWRQSICSNYSGTSQVSQSEVTRSDTLSIHDPNEFGNDNPQSETGKKLYGHGYMRSHKHVLPDEMKWITDMAVSNLAPLICISSASLSRNVYILRHHLPSAPSSAFSSPHSSFYNNSHTSAQPQHHSSIQITSAFALPHPAYSLDWAGDKMVVGSLGKIYLLDTDLEKLLDKEERMRVEGVKVVKEFYCIDEQGQTRSSNSRIHRVSFRPPSSPGSNSCASSFTSPTHFASLASSTSTISIFDISKSQHPIHSFPYLSSDPTKPITTAKWANTNACGGWAVAVGSDCGVGLGGGNGYGNEGSLSHVQGAAGPGAMLGVVDARMAEKRGLAWVKFSAHSQGITDIQWSPFIPYWLASCGNDAVVNLWDVRFNSGPVATLDGGHCNGITSLAWSNSHLTTLMTGSKDSSCNLWRIDLSSPSPLKSYSPESESSITLDSKISNSSITLNPASSSASFDHQYYLGRADSDVKVMQEFNELKKPVNKLLAESKLSQRGSIVKLMSSGQEYFCWYGVSSLGELSVIESRGFEVGDEKVAPAAVDISQARNGVDIERQSKQLIQKREIKRAKELIEEGSKMGQIRHSHLNSLLTPPIPPPPPAFPSTRYESFNDLAFTFDQPLKPSSLRNEFDEDWVEARKAFVADLEKFGDHGDGRLPPGFAELEVKVFEKYNPQSSLPISKLKQSILSKTKAGKFEKKGDQSLFDDIHVLRNQLEIVLENKNWKAGLTLAENVYTALRRSLDSISIDTLKQLTLLFLKHSYPEGLHFGLSITQIFASSSRNSTSPHDTAASSNSGKHVNFKNEHKFNKLKEIIHWLLFPTVYDLDDKVDAERRRLFSKSATTKSAVSSSETGEGARYQRKYDSAVDVNDKNDELLNHESRGGWMDLLQGLKSGYDLDAEEWSDVAVAKKRYDELRRRIKGALSGFLADDSLVGGMLELEMKIQSLIFSSGSTSANLSETIITILRPTRTITTATTRLYLYSLLNLHYYDEYLFSALSLIRTYSAFDISIALKYEVRNKMIPSLLKFTQKSTQEFEIAFGFDGKLKDRRKGKEKERSKDEVPEDVKLVMRWLYRIGKYCFNEMGVVGLNDVKSMMEELNRRYSEVLYQLFHTLSQTSSSIAQREYDSLVTFIMTPPEYIPKSILESKHNYHLGCNEVEDVIEGLKQIVICG